MVVQLWHFMFFFLELLVSDCRLVGVFVIIFVILAYVVIITFERLYK